MSVLPARKICLYIGMWNSLISLRYQTLVLEGKINIKFHTSKIESNAHMRQISDTSNLTMTYTQKNTELLTAQ